MKILSIRIKGFQQFQDTFLDFTDPETGEAAEKICLIGRNGTGKSTILRLLRDFYIKNKYSSLWTELQYPKSNSLQKLSERSGLIAIKHCYQGIDLISLQDGNNQGFWLNGKIDGEQEDWFFKLDASSLNENLLDSIIGEYIVDIDSSKELISTVLKPWKKSGGKTLFIDSPAESLHNSSLQIGVVPETSLNDALALFNEFPIYHEISNETISDFWKVLVYLVKKREEEREQFETRSENLEKTKKQLIQEFDEQNPKILEKLSEIWNTILDRAGLEFDLENAKSPVQLNDNLKAFIRHKASGQVIQYNELSTGVRNFIFRIGHIFSLYFGRTIDQGFLMVDEPENSLFPDLLLDLIEVYERATTDKNGNRNTQMFFATHSPLVAAQFEPHERVILEWDEVGAVTASKGVAPVGDDPNDVLIQDFHLANLMGKAGQEKWEEYLSLKKKLRKSEYPAEKEQLISQINEIGNTYNFDADKPL